MAGAGKAAEPWRGPPRPRGPLGLWCLVLVLAALAALGAASDDWSQCPAACKCKWVSGKKAAECVQYELTAVPRGLSPELQSVDLSQNPLQMLPRDAFRDVGLVNLHKLFLRDCAIRELHQEAFGGLEILIELDLTSNQIHTLHPGTFRDNVRLRLLYLNKNPITSLPDGLFANMTFLQTVELSDCQLTHISHRAFQNVPNLQHLKLDGNRLQHLQLQAVESLGRLVGLVLHNNPWRCDCKLRPLRDWTMDRKLYTKPTACTEPQKLRGKPWSDLQSDDFACRPQILAPPQGTVLEADTDEVTLSCKVNGNPPPEVQWVHNSRVIGNNSRSVYGDQRFVVLEGPVDPGDVPPLPSHGAHDAALGASVRWVNLTIRGVRPQDRGQFVCVAQSGGGVDERNVTLKVSRSYSGGGLLVGPGGSVADAWPLIAGLVAGVVLLLLATVLLCCCLARRRRDLQRRDAALVIGKKPPPDGRSPNGDVAHHVRADGSEQQKSLLTMVNPVQKPPRRYDHPSGLSGQGGTELSELSELNRNLLDDGSIYGGHVDDEGRSLDSVGGLTPQRSGSEVEAPVATDRSHRAPAPSNSYPPDLLAFPSRSASVTGGPHSPASTASTALCGTLPYSRSQSPFSPPLNHSLPLVQPRSGYVTIPRRPRVPSWSSPTPTPCLEDPLLLKLEPVYDNMGPRTTADGSSVLSLNKTGLDNSPVRSVPPRVAPSPLPAYYSPIEEQDNRTNTPVNGHHHHHYHSLGRPAAPAKLSTPVDRNGTNRRGSWSRISPESTGTLGRQHAGSRASEASASDRDRDDSLLMPGTAKRPSSIASVSSANSTTPLTNGNAVRTVKVPPKPPPKPKKKVGPLFEDEGEDGTEV